MKFDPEEDKNEDFISLINKFNIDYTNLNDYMRWVLKKFWEIFKLISESEK